jgi:hypothetical protein
MNYAKVHAQITTLEHSSKLHSVNVRSTYLPTEVTRKGASSHA